MAGAAPEELDKGQGLCHQSVGAEHASVPLRLGVRNSGHMGPGHSHSLSISCWVFPLAEANEKPTDTGSQEWAFLQGPSATQSSTGAKQEVDLRSEDQCEMAGAGRTPHDPAGRGPRPLLVLSQGSTGQPPAGSLGGLCAVSLPPSQHTSALGPAGPTPANPRLAPSCGSLSTGGLTGAPLCNQASLSRVCHSAPQFLVSGLT